MQRNDGHRLLNYNNVYTNNNIDKRYERMLKMIPSSRWEEIKECIHYHIRLSGLIGAHTSFRVSIQIRGEKNCTMTP